MDAECLWPGACALCRQRYASRYQLARARRNQKRYETRKRARHDR